MIIKSTVQTQNFKQSLPKVSLKRVTYSKFIAEFWTLTSNQMIKDCVCYVFTSVSYFTSKALFICHEVIKCASMKHETQFTE